MCIQTYTCIHTHAYIQIHTYTRIHTHAYTYAYTHIHRSRPHLKVGGPKEGVREYHAVARHRTCGSDA